MTTYSVKNEALAVPDESKRPLRSYHDTIKQRLDDDVELHGLTGKDNAIRRIVVSGELSESAKSDLERYLNAEIAMDSDDQS